MSTNLMRLIRDLTKRVNDLTDQVNELQEIVNGKPNKRKRKKLVSNSQESDEAILLELSQTYEEYLVVDEDGTLDVHWGKLQDRVGRQIVGNREEEVKWGFPILNQGKSLSDEDMRSFRSEMGGIY